MNDDEKLIRAKLRWQRFNRWADTLIRFLAIIALLAAIASSVYVTWFKP